MTMGPIEQTLITKFKAGNLPHFFNVKLRQSMGQNDKQKTESMKQWSTDFISGLIGLSIPNQGKLVNHPDILFIGLDKEDNKKYVIDDFDPLFSFNAHNPLELKSKITVIFHAQLINEIIFNKLLKILEAPDVANTIFLINPLAVELLSTIESRSISLRVNPQQESATSNDSQLNDAQNLSLCDFVDKYRNEEASLNAFVLEKVLQNQDAQQTHQSLELLRLLQSSKAINNSSSTRAHAVYNFLKNLS